ncbi:hypothetical protein RF55_135 [Lasius niger]|uniref:Uncharacterized protein n=1 Tax=Lasius niger TaxID=67767 RepID=A0A0J7LAX9_LASNI|nr:hypothetical protein RF55_135 [Lasius niger]
MNTELPLSTIGADRSDTFKLMFQERHMTFHYLGELSSWTNLIFWFYQTKWSTDSYRRKGKVTTSDVVNGGSDVKEHVADVDHEDDDDGGGNNDDDDDDDDSDGGGGDNDSNHDDSDGDSDGDDSDVDDISLIEISSI